MKIYLVGGAVRDKLLGIEVKDHDWVVVGATPEELLRRGFQQVGKDFPVFLHPETREEYALARTERKSARGYTGFTCDFNPQITLEEDLRRRDLTINAIAESEQGELVDPFHGAQDLQSKMLRHVSDAFIEDPLRVFRVARFAARYHHLGFTIANETLTLMQTIAQNGELDALTAERVWLETEKALSEISPWVYFEVLNQTHCLKPWFSELAPFLSESTPSRASIINSLSTCSKSHSKPSIRWSSLLYPLKSNLKTLQKRLKAPNEFQQLATQVATVFDVLSTCQKVKQDVDIQTTASTLLNIVLNSDSIRKPERFQDIIKTLYSIAEMDSSINNAAVDQLHQAQIAATTISIDDLKQQNLTGAAMGAAIKERRLQAIENMLENTKPNLNS